MVRHQRNDSPGAWHHVMNRGIAKRTLFETELDIRMFLACIARAVRAGLLEVHAYCIMTTHFHLLVRSPKGELSAAMAVVQNEYSRWFNRTRKRDGPLYRSRFRSKRAGCPTYRQHLVRYIDANPVSANLTITPAAYPHGSARWYAQRRGPIWLSRGWVESIVTQRCERQAFDPADYARTFGTPLTPGLQRLVEKRIVLSNDGDDPLDDLLGAARGRVAEWMQRKAALADGTEIGMPVCDPDDVDEAIAVSRSEWGDWILSDRTRTTQAWPAAHVALLRDLCGSTLAEASVRTGSTVSRAWQRYDLHKSSIVRDASYAERIAMLAERALERCHHAWQRSEA
jgi:REP element-mobilizing transposase RayT